MDTQEDGYEYTAQNAYPNEPWLVEFLQSGIIKTAA